MSRQKSIVGGVVIATQPVLFNGKRTKMRFFMFLVSKCLQCLYFMLFILIEAMPRCLYSHTYHNHNATHFGHKNGEKPDFDDF